MFRGKSRAYRHTHPRGITVGDASRAFALCNFTDSAKPTLLVVGGSSGSRSINTAIRDLLPELIKNYNIIHLCGKGNVDTSPNAIAGYAQFEYANEELADLFALSSLVISRAGANAICELSHCANRISRFRSGSSQPRRSDLKRQLFPFPGIQLCS